MPSKYEKFIIDPKLGVGPIKFGMHQKKIRQNLEAPLVARQLRVHYTNELTCNGLEFYGGSRVYLGEFQIMGINLNQVIACFLLVDPKLQIGEDYILSEALCIYIGTTQEETSKLRKVNSIHIFSSEALASYKALKPKSSHSKIKDYIGKINQEGVSLLGLSLLMICFPVLWLTLQYLLDIGLPSGEKVFSRYFGWQDAEGFWLAVILIGLILLLIEFILRLRGSSSILHKSDWSYILSKQRGRLYLNVVCGGVGVYSVDVQLTQEQRREFWRKGIPFIDSMAENICYYGKADYYQIGALK